MKPIRVFGAIAVIASVAAPLIAQDDTGVYAIRGARIHTLTGPAIESGTVVLQNGLITAVGANVTVPAGAQVLDGSGLEVYPGLFDAMSRMGLTEIGQVVVTRDMTELGEFNPHLLAATAVHPASEVIPVTRANGITHTVAAPDPNTGGMGGQGSLIHLDGWTVEEMLIVPSVGVVLEWPSLRRRRRFGGFGGGQATSFRERQEQYDEQIKEIEGWIEAARHYATAMQSGSDSKRDLKLEALTRVVTKELPFIVVANDERDIRNVLDFAERNDVEVIIAGGNDAWKVKDELAAAGVPVLLGPTQRLPSQEDEGYDQPYATPGELYLAGVKIGFASFNASSSRTLPYEAAMGVSYGLPWEEAIRAVTLYPAQIFGVDDKLGTIEEGKIGNLIVTDGDPLEIQTQILHLYINGHPTSTDNKHQSSYEKYRSRPRR